MLVAIPTWQGRVSPVFDVATRLTLMTLEGPAALETTEVAFTLQSVAARVEQLAQWKVNVLLCGAISGCLERLLKQRGIHVVPYVCGPVHEVLRNYLQNRLAQNGMIMPGCRCPDADRGGGRGHRCGRSRPPAAGPTTAAPRLAAGTRKRVNR